MKNVQKSIVSIFMAMLWASPALALSVQSLPEIASAESVNAADAQFFGVCTGDGVSVRDLPDKSGNKIGFLYAGQAVYPLGKKDTNEEYPWVYVITENGAKGWMYGKYVSVSEDAENGKFRTQFGTSVFFDMQGLMRAAGLQSSKAKRQTVNENDPGNPYYADSKLSFAEGFTFYMNGDEPYWVVLDKKGYKAAGLQVGDTLDKNVLDKFNAGMTAMGWEPMTADEENQKYQWILYRTIDEMRRPAQSFSIKAENGKIKSMDWGLFLID